MVKDRFAEAVKAEGLPVAPNYDHIVYDAPWLRDRRTFGHSGHPWTGAPFGRDLSYDEYCPNARRAIATHMMVAIHEGWSDREVADLAVALRKVEKAYAR